jgi:aryl-alcohol dehydrogenase-like predicted oxidoreductase
MDAALDLGVNFFDTANHYPNFENCGRTEEVIGRWFRTGSEKRKRVVLATKVYQPMMDPLDGPNNEPGLSIYKIRRHIEGSLRRLQTEHVELYQMHHNDKRVQWDEIWEAFESLVRRGVIDYVGSSNFSGWQLVEAQWSAKMRNFIGLASEQHKYNLLCRLPELEVLPAAKHLGIGLVVYSPLAAGLLSGRALNPADGSRAKAFLKSDAKLNEARLKEYSIICRSIGEEDATVALAWVLRNASVDSVIVGPRTVEQLRSSIKALEVSLSQETMVKIETIFPGPGGPGPEAYAW